MGLGEAVDATIPRSHIPSPKSNFLKIILIFNSGIDGFLLHAIALGGKPLRMVFLNFKYLRLY